MLDEIVLYAPIFLLAAARCFSMIMTLPLFSIRAVPRIAKLALAGYMAYLIFPHADFSMYAPYLTVGSVFAFEYLLLVAGEVAIGIIIGFYVSIIFSAFSTAGQFFAFQMGFSASEVYDALSQVENPLMGQFFNFVAMLLFLQNHWAQNLFGSALVASFDSMNAVSIVSALGREKILWFMLSSLTRLFANAFVIALPIMGTLLLISVTMGILSKAAPQMNLLSEGFPIMIMLAFFIIATVMGSICDYFIGAFASGFENLQSLFAFFSRGAQ